MTSDIQPDDADRVAVARRRRADRRQARGELAAARSTGLRHRRAAKLARISATLPDALRTLRARVAQLVDQVRQDPDDAAVLAELISTETTLLITRGPAAYMDHVEHAEQLRVETGGLQ